MKEVKTCKHCEHFDYILVGEGVCISPKNDIKDIDIMDSMGLDWVTVNFGCIHWEKKHGNL